MYDTKLGISVGQNWGENFHKSKILKFKPIMYGGSKRSYRTYLKQPAAFSYRFV